MFVGHNGEVKPRTADGEMIVKKLGLNKPEPMRFRR
jgi:hypothetical protein